MSPDYLYTTLYCNKISYFLRVLGNCSGHRRKWSDAWAWRKGRSFFAKDPNRIQSREPISVSYFLFPTGRKGNKFQLVKGVRRSALRLETLCGEGKDLETCSSQVSFSKPPQVSTTQKRRLSPPSPVPSPKILVGYTRASHLGAL